MSTGSAEDHRYVALKMTPRDEVSTQDSDSTSNLSGVASLVMPVAMRSSRHWSYAGEVPLSVTSCGLAESHRFSPRRSGAETRKERHRRRPPCGVPLGLGLLVRPGAAGSNVVDDLFRVATNAADEG